MTRAPRRPTNGIPGRTRTCNRRLRRAVPYPIGPRRQGEPFGFLRVFSPGGSKLGVLRRERGSKSFASLSCRVARLGAHNSRCGENEGRSRSLRSLHEFFAQGLRTSHLEERAGVEPARLALAGFRIRCRRHLSACLSSIGSLSEGAIGERSSRGDHVSFHGCRRERFAFLEVSTKIGGGRTMEYLHERGQFQNPLSLASPVGKNPTPRHRGAKPAQPAQTGLRPLTSRYSPHSQPPAVADDRSRDT